MDNTNTTHTNKVSKSSDTNNPSDADKIKRTIEAQKSIEAYKLSDACTPEEFFKPRVGNIDEGVYELEKFTHILSILLERIETQRHTFTEKDFRIFESNLRVVHRNYDYIIQGLSSLK